MAEALTALGHKVEQQKQLMVVSDAEHAKGHPDVEIDIKAGSDIGFRWNEDLEIYELVTDLQAWNQPIDQRFFIQKLQQEYALLSIVSSVTLSENLISENLSPTFISLPSAPINLEVLVILLPALVK